MLAAGREPEPECRREGGAELLAIGYKGSGGTLLLVILYRNSNLVLHGRDRDTLMGRAFCHLGTH